MSLKLPTGRECRRLTNPIELRSKDAGESGSTVFGYAAKFNSRSENLGTADYQFYEIIEPGAFDDVLMDDVRALFNHGPDGILARSKNGKGTLKIGVDETGLSYEFEAPDTQVGRDLLVSLKRGDIDQSSFSFSVPKDGQKWTETKDGDGTTIITRTISKIGRLYDVSPVTYPAYSNTDVDCRSFIKEFRGETGAGPELDAPKETSKRSYWQRRFSLIEKPAQNKQIA